MIRKAETTRISLVLENEMLDLLDYVAEKLKMTRSELIRELLMQSIEKNRINLTKKQEKLYVNEQIFKNKPQKGEL